MGFQGVDQVEREETKRAGNVGIRFKGSKGDKVKQEGGAGEDAGEGARDVGGRSSFWWNCFTQK